MDNKCTLIVNSCDKYEDLWNPFFTLLKKQWQDLSYPIVLNTESKNYYFENLAITTFSLYKKNENIEWSERLIETLKRIDSEFILFMLDDFFLQSKVNTEKINQCLKWLEKDKNIATFCFMPVMDSANKSSEKYEGFELRPRNGEYRLNCQAGIWRKEHLIKYLRPHESAWLFETLGSKRSRRYAEEFYCIVDEKAIMNYDFREGGALHRGKWNRSVVKYCKENNININVSSRGFNEMISGSTKSKWQYYKERVKINRLIKALNVRWKSLKR